MSRTNILYVPDELWNELGNSIDHFEYDTTEKGVSTAIYTDGRRVEFSSIVTKELLDDDRNKWLKEQRERAARGECLFYEFFLKVKNPRFHKQLVGFTS